MAQLAQIQLEIDVTPARRAIKRVLRHAQEANRELAALEERTTKMEESLAAHVERLEALGITVSAEG